MSRINNEFRLSGRMGGTLEKSFNPNNGNPIGRVSLAVDNSYTDRDSGEIVERTTWLDLTFYNAKQIERLEKFGGKGREIHVMGTIGKDIWESKTRKNEDGTPAKDSRVTLTVNSLLLGREPSAQGQQGSEQASSAATGGFDGMDDDIPL